MAFSHQASAVAPCWSPANATAVAEALQRPLRHGPSGGLGAPGQLHPGGLEHRAGGLGSGAWTLETDWNRPQNPGIYELKMGIRWAFPLVE